MAKAIRAVPLRMVTMLKNNFVFFFFAGFVVGQSGLYEAVGMLVLSYFIIGMTVLSVCAISTNGALDAGGAYCILYEKAVVTGV